MNVDPEPPARPLPSWFVAGLAAAIVWCATAGAVGIALLVVGWYHAVLVGGVATIAAATTGVVAVRRLGPREPADHYAAVAAVGVVLAFFVLAGAFHSEHLLRDRDPAVYITTGRSIARTHQLRPKTHFGAFTAPTFGPADARYQPDFFPMLPVLLAMGWSVGGDSGLLLVGPVLGSLGLLACYALAARVLNARLALLALAVLAVLPLQLWFARDAYSELVVQVVVLGGVWLYLEARTRRCWTMALIAGGVLASSALARVDALAVVVGVLAFVAMEWTRSESDPEPLPARRTVLAFGGAVTLGAVVALATTHHVAHRYVTSLGAEYRELVAAFAATIVAVFAVVVIHRLQPGLGRRIAAWRYLFPALAVASTGVFGWAYAFRPDPRRDLLSSQSGQPVTGAVRAAIESWHYSRSLHWFSAYIGVVGLVAAFVGFGVLAARARRGNTAAAAVFLVVIPVAVLYLARPSIQPGQPWAMRRYLPAVIPGIAIALVSALHAAWIAARTGRGARARAAATVATVGAVFLVAVPTAWAAGPFVTARMQHGAEAAVHGLCRFAGRDGAFLVYGGHGLDVELTEMFRAFCGVPVANSGVVDLVQLSRQWHALGRRLLVVTPLPKTVFTNAAHARVVARSLIADDDDPERIYDRAPRRFVPAPIELWVLEIPTSGP